ncbi:sensor histidine kinase [Pseudonocardia broussonetiae]|uniref:Sensor histidine kinase n=1 Tax=Pseudonocardia broussonetiae TaxID=2736640 RepID=A0A6M6JPW1_9PSEU|nr:histidine kinase [Pseudonocardia broussonetiae]QJY48469.1 sensor histidine kinase [Pseudonocardia broussonetiae]
MTGLVVAALVVGAAWAVAAGAARRTRSPALALGCAGLAAAHAAATAWPALVPLVLAGWAAFGGAALAAALRWRRAAPAARRVLQWVVAAAVLAGAVVAVLAALHLMLGAPGDLAAWGTAAAALVPLGLACGLLPATAPAAPAALVEAVVVTGLAVLVVGVYLVVVVGLGRVPVGGEREVLVSGIVAAIVAAVLVVPVRTRLVALAEALVGRRGGQAGAMTSFGARMTRAVPLDELLLQLAESLRASLAPAGAEVWVGAEGVLDRAVAVPDRPAGRVVLGPEERVVVGRARSGGARWMSVWLPGLLDDHTARHGADAPVRAVPVAHLGALLGLLVVHRPAGADPFSDDDDHALVELARQLGLALHNVTLDSALQASLEELRTRNAELQASRARIVTAADESRRGIERDLHDGAQQHLVALAVRIGLARTVLDADPAAVPALLDQLRTDAQAAIGAVRELAHGIYPPLLRERGLGEALRTAAARSPLRCAVEVQATGRFGQDVESCVYFCCLEAIQNAGKHAGAGSEILVSVTHTDGVLRFRVSDDGAGFDPDAAGTGHGFVNMRDRLGAVGGTLEIVAAPGAGAAVVGSVPMTARTP